MFLLPVSRTSKILLVRCGIYIVMEVFQRIKKSKERRNECNKLTDYRVAESRYPGLARILGFAKKSN